MKVNGLPETLGARVFVRLMGIKKQKTKIPDKYLGSEA